MKKIISTVFLVTLVLLTGCVQKVVKKTVVFELNTAGIQNIKSVGLRGNDRPLSWDKNYEMTAIKKDSLYTATITGTTGYKFSEIKFVINDGFEFENESNRRIVFADGDTTIYKATFNKR
jgi:hypothetical protein